MAPPTSCGPHAESRVATCGGNPWLPAPPHLAPGGALSHSLNNLQRLFTPPVIPPGMAMGARGLSLSHATPPRALVATRKGSKSAAGSAERPAEGTGPGGDDEREELDLLYDGILNCYYDPRTNKYYELA